MAFNSDTAKKAGAKSSRKGTPNKDTKELRLAIAAFTSNNMERIQGLFDQVAADDPAKALDLWLKTIEYSTAKLKSIEHKGEKPPLEKITIEVIEPNSKGKK